MEECYGFGRAGEPDSMKRIILRGKVLEGGKAA